ncbi:MAG: IS30 family transposase [Gammaproteobacteria bacterium]|nr:IS30 family transposase [Gammaproteobacteria bacterium]
MLFTPPINPAARLKAGRGHIKNRIGIEERPGIVDKKERVGDWEIDLVIGKGHSGALVTIVERVPSFAVSKHVDDKSATTATAARIELLSPFRGAVHTVTADNGKEFAYHEEVAKALDTTVYFADPCYLWQLRWLCTSRLNLPNIRARRLSDLGDRSEGKPF